MRTLAATLVLLAFAAPAEAIRCAEWTRLAVGQKQQTVDALIDDLFERNRVRQVGVDRAAMRRCLQGYASWIQEDFDAACAEGLRADLRVLDRIFKKYAWSCVR